MAEPIRVLYVIGTLNVGGTERQLVQLASRLDRRIATPTVCCLEEEGPLAAPLRQAGVPVKEVPFRGLSALRNPLRTAGRFRELLTLVRRVAPDVLHAYLPHANALGSLAGRLAGVPVLVTSHRGMESGLAGWSWLAARLADACVANASAVARHVAAAGVPGRKLRVIRNGLDLDGFDAASRRPAPGLPSGRLVVTVANANRFKTDGLLILVQAAARVVRAVPGVRFLIVGDGPCLPRLRAAVEEQALSPAVRLLGLRHDVPAILARCDVAVLPSLHEGLPNVVLEAMAAGLPVVATRVGGVPEAVLDGVTGRLVESGAPDALADALIAVLRDPGTGQAMGRAGRERVVREFSLDRMVEETQALYGELMSKGGRRSGWRKVAA